MRTFERAGSALLIAGLGMVVCAAQTQGIDGTWSLDRARSGPLPPGMEQTMTIVRDGESGLKVETTIVTDFADRVQDDAYVFDGAEHEVATPGIGKGKRTATRIDDRSFRSIDQLKGPTGETTVERAWSLSEDGRELTVDLTTNGFAGKNQSHRVFTRGEAAAASAVEPSRLFPIDLTVPVPPSPFHQGGKPQLVYEVELRNFRAGDVEWRRLDVLDDAGSVIASYEGDDLASILARPGAPPGYDQPRRIGAGMMAIAYLWVGVDGAVPRALRHRVTLSLPSAASSRRIVESGPVTVGPKAIVVGPPARGSGWVVRWLSNTSFHRRGLFPVDGHAQIAQRFAIDWNRYDEKGIEQTGDESQNATYSVYGRDIIAVADATVVKVIDGVPQNTPPSIAPGVAYDPEKALGNSAVLALPGGLFATYAHMQPGSIRVKVGERVRRGQLLGRVGNSGNATGPHLHFHIAKAPGLAGEGVPYEIDAFEQMGLENVDGDKPAWDPSAGKPSAVRTEMPVEHAVVAFH